MGQGACLSDHAQSAWRARGQPQPPGPVLGPRAWGKPAERLRKGATRALERGVQWGTASPRTAQTAPTRCRRSHLLGAEWLGTQEAESPAVESAGSPM